MSHHCKYPHLPNDEGSAIYVSCGECGPAGKGRAHSPTSASGPGAHRGSSMLVGDDDGEGDLPKAQRKASPSITPSSRAVAGEESRRAVDRTTPTAARAQSAPALLLVERVKRGPSRHFLLLSASLARERRRDRLHKRARSEAHAPSPFARMPVRRAHPH